ncbi:hypothetical protein BH09PAT1_BH09PAT1_2390 [soil metagenome]
MNSKQPYCGIEYKKESMWSRIITAILIGIVFGTGYLILSEFSVVPTLSNSLTLPTVFLLGIIASVSSCMATAGTVFLSAINKIKGNRVIPTIHFNIGRIITYTVMGYILGLIGKTVSVQYETSVFLTIGVSTAMIFVGLDMLKIFSISSLVPSFIGKYFENKIEKQLFRQSHKTMFMLGVITYWLPCGFTQTVQLFALGTADPIKSAMVMGVFALGTAPALLSMGVTSSFTNAFWYPWFLKTVGVVVILFSVSYIVNTMQLYTDSFIAIRSPAYTKKVGEVKVQNGVQIVEMSVINTGYTPNTFVVQKDIPVKWVVNGINIYGCQGFLNVPKLGIQQALKLGKNVFEFTLKKSDTISFSCSNNSVQGLFHVI